MRTIRQITVDMDILLSDTERPRRVIREELKLLRKELTEAISAVARRELTRVNERIKRMDSERNLRVIADQGEKELVEILAGIDSLMKRVF